MTFQQSFAFTQPLPVPIPIADATTTKALIESALPIQPLHLLVVVGTDLQLQVDLTAFRKLRAHGQVRFNRLVNVTSLHFERYLERARMARDPVRYLHMAVHSNGSEIALADTWVDGTWLSERLQDVEILFLAGCHGDLIGDLLSIVPCVVTVTEEISHHHAMLLAESFWSEIALGREPRHALENALDRCPPVLSEFAQLHMN